MQLKRKIMLLLVAIVLMGAMLTGCNDRDHDNYVPTETSQPAPERGRDRNNSNDELPPLPTRNPDGSLG